MLLRRVIGDALRARRQAQHRTLREVSTAANVSLGYLSEIERGQKEASSELLAAICEALGAALSEVLRDVSDTLAHAEDLPRVLVPVGAPESGSSSEAAPVPEQAPAAPASAEARLSRGTPKAKVGVDAKLSVAVRHDGPLRTTLRATRNPREVVYAA
ncbi:helix-turn-helix transcriptional regulator [Dactylosporangium sp. NPDC049525]|uniref:helix-turn-helix domain-containing protein n=1 Tax=Dactylosporangium sp. NPDC049525 TaxID=3154730 RepID=UPI00343C40A7